MSTGRTATRADLTPLFEPASVAVVGLDARIVPRVADQA